MIVGHAAALALSRAGVPWVSGVPGESFLPLLDGLRREGIAYRSTVHESGAVFMATAYARATGTPAVAAVTRAPGASNALIGIHEAAQAFAPVVLIVGQLESSMLGRRRALQSMEIDKVFASVAKRAVEVAGPEYVTAAIMAALRLAASGEPGPVVVSVPADYWSAEVDDASVELYHMPESTTSMVSGQAISELAALVQGASAGLLVAGAAFRAGSHADLLGRVAAATGFGVLGGHGFPDVLPAGHEYWLGCSTIRGSDTVKEALTQADAIVFLDEWPADRVTQGYRRLTERMAIVSATATGGWDEYPQARLFAGDPVAAVAALLEQLPALSHPVPSWIAGLRSQAASQAKVVLEASGRDHGRISFADVVAQLAGCLPDRATLVSDAGSFNDWFMRYFPFKAGQTYLGTLSGSMGYAVPGAIGAHLARPDAKTVALTGDGGFLMTGLEMATMAQAGVPATVLVFNNGEWGSIALHQDREFSDGRFATALPEVSYAGIARSVGVDATVVESAEELGPALARSFSIERPSLVEILTDGVRPSPASYDGGRGPL